MPTSDPPRPEMSVIVCTRNGAAHIVSALDSLDAQVSDVAWEIVVADNGSTDSTVDIVRSHSLRVPLRIVDASSQVGLAFARNVGVANSYGTYVAFCDDDDEVDPGWLDALTRALRTHPFVGSRMEYRELNSAAALVGRAEIQSTTLGEVFGRPVVNGALGISRELWDSVGGNDESLDVSSEDHDFSIRVTESSGVVPVLVRDAVYHYRVRDGVRASFRQGCAYGFGHVQLFVRYGSGSMSTDDVARARRAWWWIVSRSPIHPFTARRSAWARQCGVRIGRIRGSVVHRCWYL